MGESLGEFRVGKSFNPSSLKLVDDIKQKAAELIDLINLIPKPENDEFLTSEIGRLKSLAMTHTEDAAMWAVKAATKKR
jgi:hypothetical protein